MATATALSVALAFYGTTGVLEAARRAQLSGRLGCRLALVGATGSPVRPLAVVSGG